MNSAFHKTYIQETEKTKGEMIDRTYRIENRNSLVDSELRKKFLIFHHITRTGGSAINDILFRMQEETGIPLIIPGWEQAFSEDPPWQGRPAPLVITAHYTFGLHERISEPTAYFTMMRDPYAHFLAIFLRRDEGYRYPGESMGDIWANFERKIDEIRDRVGHGNLQTYEYATYSRNKPASSLDIYTGFFQNMEKTSPQDLFSKAVENLESMFFFVGITELFEESLFLLFHMIGIRETLMWRPGLYTYWRPGKDEMPRRIHRKVSTLLEMDLELYHRNRQVLENMLAEADFGEELIDYKQHARNPYGRLYRELSERFEVAAKTFGFFSHVVESEFRHSQSVIRNIRELSSDFEKTREEQLENQGAPRQGLMQRLLERLMAVIRGIKGRIVRIYRSPPPRM